MTSQFPQPEMQEIGKQWPLTIAWVLERRNRGPLHRLLIWWGRR